MHGVLILDKPARLTSHDVVAAIRKLVPQTKVGHYGTLDPLATGVLPVALGKATRLQQFYLSSRKIYQGTMRFGFSTTTYDSEGAATSEPQTLTLTPDQIESARQRFIGALEQMPPAFSAKKVKGVSAYRLARHQQPVNLRPQRVHVDRFALSLRSAREADFEVQCSSGTYVRSLAHDLGQVLGCGAHLLSLRRLASGEFRIEDSIQFSILQTARAVDFLTDHLISLNCLVSWIPRLTLAPEEIRRVNHGISLVVESDRLAATSCGYEERDKNWVRLFTGEGELLGLAQSQPVAARGSQIELKPKIVFSN